MSYCKPCAAENYRDWSAADIEKARRSRKDRQLRTTFGISLTDYERMYEDQDGCCAICHDPQVEDTRMLAVDHCHTSGLVRALLCSRCNTGLGAFRDRPDLLSSAITYLDRFATAPA